MLFIQTQTLIQNNPIFKITPQHQYACVKNDNKHLKCIEPKLKQ